MAAVAKSMGCLIGSLVVGVVIEPGTHDLVVTFEGNFSVKTFVVDATSEESWHIRDNTDGARLKGSPRGLEVVPPK